MRLNLGWSTLLAAVAVTVLSWASFYNSINNEFVFDDDLAIVRNADVSPSTPWHLLWKHDIWGKDLLAHDSHRSYRPLMICTFKIISTYFGLTPSIFRIVSIMLHNIASFLVFLVADAVVCNSFVAFATSVFFACHPIHVESVAAVVNMAEALSAIFYLLGFLVFIKSTNNFSVGKSILSIIVCLICLFISILFKETGVTLCGLIIVQCVFHLVACVRANSLRRLEDRSSARSLLLWIQVHWMWLFVGIIGVVAYVLFRLVLVGMDPAELFVSIATLDYPRFLAAFSKAYLGESQLIRKAENPYAFLETKTEKILSYMVRAYSVCIPG
jgi:hypothetical protein